MSDFLWLQSAARSGSSGAVGASILVDADDQLSTALIGVDVSLHQRPAYVELSEEQVADVITYLTRWLTSRAQRATAYEDNQ